ncbi:3'-5' exonuclease [Brachyspira catarrhinii]|uniref:ATP-dependent helicase n=1 Tax=Brachyspira catarrhinii TaxID=2528966 RepID=A0ABY2TP61_9SPIR|nr:ATP-dependent helicase [Brachyspira catarrhinii]TKZ31713.1 ATP-dependent helicase [Brachyspira catarrhinii]
MEDDYKDRLLDIDVLITLAVEYNNNLEKFISDFALDPPSNQIQQESKPLIGQLENEALTLSTVHSAKGLEWEYVFIIHMLDGLFPSERALENIETLDEERRLFYVACTRAKSKLYITMPSVISQYNYSIFDKPSRFISEINNKYYHYSLDEYTKDDEDL